MGADTLSFSETETGLREIAELRTKYTSKKSALAALKKQIGRVQDARERAEFGQHMLLIDSEITLRLGEAERTLKVHLDTAKAERERVDVTLPGRRPRRA